MSTFVYQIAFMRRASDTGIDVRVESELKADALMLLIDRDQLDEAMLYRVHTDENGDEHYEFIRTM